MTDLEYCGTLWVWDEHDYDVDSDEKLVYTYVPEKMQIVVSIAVSLGLTLLESDHGKRSLVELGISIIEHFEEQDMPHLFPADKPFHEDTMAEEVT
jgi:hypothetical protein